MVRLLGLWLTMLIFTVECEAGVAAAAKQSRTAAPRVVQRHLRLRNPIRMLSESNTRIGAIGADVIAGSGAALVAYTVATPFETVKTVNQMAGGRTREALKSVVERSGKRGLVSYKSLKAMWTAGVPYSIILYSVYRPLKVAARSGVERIRGSNVQDKDLFAADMLAAAGAEILGLFAFIPGELIAKRMMVNPTRYAGVGSAMRSILAEEGARGLFTGFGACLVRDVPYTMLQFALFDDLASRVMKRSQGSAEGCGGGLRFEQSLLIGASAAVVASTLTLPIDVVKSQMMVAAEAVSIPALVASILATDGAGALFRGLPAYMTINIAKWSSSQAVFNKLRGEPGH